MKVGQSVKEHRILAINPGSSSTKIGVFRNERVVVRETLYHKPEELAAYRSVIEQEEYRLAAIREFLLKVERDSGHGRFDAIVGRGGMLRPIPGGTYTVDDAMVADLRAGVSGEHASNLGGILALRLAGELGADAFIVDPVVVDEMDDVARITGLPECLRRSRIHTLNMKAVAREVAQRLGRPYEELALIVVHLGTGISLAAHKNGRMVDISDPNAEGPFSVERAGGLPADQLVAMCLQGEHGRVSAKAMLGRLLREGGIYAYFRTKDMRLVCQWADDGDARAQVILDALAYQLAKAIGGLIISLGRTPDRVILTGALAYSKRLVDDVEKRVAPLAPVEVVPGERELEALVEGALRVLRGQEKAKSYAEEARKMESRLNALRRLLLGANV